MLKELIKTNYVCEYLLNLYNNLQYEEYLCIAFGVTTETPSTGLYKIHLFINSKEQSFADFNLYNAYFDRITLLDFFKKNNIKFIENLITFEEIEEQLSKINLNTMEYNIEKTSYLYIGKNITKEKVKKLI